jgi:hypothetical protein
MRRDDDDSSSLPAQRYNKESGTGVSSATQAQLRAGAVKLQSTAEEPDPGIGKNPKEYGRNAEYKIGDTLKRI